MTWAGLADMEPEDRLLIGLLRTSLGFERFIDKKDLSSPDLNWDHLVQTAEEHKVVPHIYRAILESDQSHIPQESIDRLRANFDSNAFRNLAMTGELLRLLQLFDTMGIPAIPFKGPVLSSYLYEDVSRREFLDLDILIPVERVAEVEGKLISRGYFQKRELRPAEEKAFIRYQHHYEFQNPDLGVNLEIHWRLSPRIYSLDLGSTELFERAERFNFFGREVFSFSPEDLILILCEHGTRHYWGRLAWICDVASLAAAKRIDWKASVRQAQDVGCERLLFLGLILARELLGAPITSEIAGLVEKDRKAALLAEEAMTRLFKKRSLTDGSEMGPPSNIGEELFYLQARERIRDRALYYLRRATYPTEDDWEAVSLPEPLFSLYYLIRPLRMIGKYRTRLWKWFFR